MDSIHSIILKFRLKNSYNQANMAFDLRISQKSYSDIESGKTKLKLSHLLKIAFIFKMHPNDLIDKIMAKDYKYKSENELKIEKLQMEIKELNIKVMGLQKTISLQKQVVEKLSESMIGD